MSDEEKQAKYVEANVHVMHPVSEAIRPLHPSKIWDDISPQFLTTFWSLTMYDLSVPDKVYASEIAKLKAMPAKVDENKVRDILLVKYMGKYRDYFLSYNHFLTHQATAE